MDTLANKNPATIPAESGFAFIVVFLACDGSRLGVRVDGCATTGTERIEDISIVATGLTAIPDKQMQPKRQASGGCSPVGWQAEAAGGPTAKKG